MELKLAHRCDKAATKRVSMAVFWHPTCSQHRIPDHPESHHRVDQILVALRKMWPSELAYIESSMITDEIILLFHTPKLLNRFHKLSKDTEDAYKKQKKVVYKSIDSDTQVMWQTKNASYYAAGAVLDAIDRMYSDRQEHRIDTAFCCVRPPGHHAERGTASGFCYLNNVAIGAKYAQYKHGVKKVAVLDFDVHHGNGTEEGFTPDQSLFYGSTHGRDHFPGTGCDPSPYVAEKSRDPLHRRIVNRELTPLKPSRVEFRIMWGQILGEMELFKPDLVIMSTGFDAHEDDPLADCALQDEDYEWITTEIVTCCHRLSASMKSQVRYLSVLEGGYDIPAIQRSSICHVRAMLQSKSPLCEASTEVKTTGLEETVHSIDINNGPLVEKESSSQYCRKDGEVLALQEMLNEMGIGDR